jgi:hypothetical protein
MSPPLQEGELEIEMPGVLDCSVVRFEQNALDLLYFNQQHHNRSSKPRTSFASSYRSNYRAQEPPNQHQRWKMAVSTPERRVAAQAECHLPQGVRRIDEPPTQFG